MEFRQLRYFVAVAQERHFGRAAARLHVAQPALSQQILNLERELGAELIERSARPIALTTAGRSVFVEAQRTLRQLDLVEERTRRADRGHAGRLTIGFLGSVGHDLIPTLMTTFKRQRPGVQLELEEMLFHDQLQGFHEGRIHVGFVRLPLDDARLETERLRDDPSVALVPESHRLARATSIRFAELADEPWVFVNRSAWTSGWNWWQALCRRHGFIPDVAATATSLEVLVGLVAAGSGVAFLPAASRALPRPGVAAIPIEDVTSTAALAWLPERNSVLVRDFVRTAVRLAARSGDSATVPAR